MGKIKELVTYYEEIVRLNELENSTTQISFVRCLDSRHGLSDISCIVRNNLYLMELLHAPWSPERFKEPEDYRTRNL